MIQSAATRILGRLKTSGTSAIELALLSRNKQERIAWEQDPGLYREFGLELIRLGRYTRAFDLIREGLRFHEGDVELKYLRALALARGGNLTKATECVAELLAGRSRMPSRLRSDVLGLAGRLWKDRYEKAREPEEKKTLAATSARHYAHAHRISGKPYPGINAATMFLLAGHPRKAKRLAATVVRQAQVERRRKDRENDYWLTAMVGEAWLILGDTDQAVSAYRDAVRLAADHVGDIASMRRNVRLLSAALGGADAVLNGLNIGTVVLFSGHMVDRPVGAGAVRTAPRFPRDLRFEGCVRDEIATALEALQARVGFCSAACGSDVLFAEAMLSRHAELHVVLPFDKNDFYATSVDFGRADMASWRRRFDVILNCATAVHYATSERHMGDDSLFEFCNALIQGLSLTRAAELSAKPVALAALDPSSRSGLGGTRQFLEAWTDRGGEARIIDVARFRGPDSGAALPGFSTKRPSGHPRHVGQPSGRQIKAMLFADLKNFSRIAEEYVPAFFVQYLAVVASELRVTRRPPIFRNTWGDGLFMVCSG